MYILLRIINKILLLIIQKVIRKIFDIYFEKMNIIYGMMHKKYFKEKDCNEIIHSIED